MKDHVKLHQMYTSALIRSLRVLLLFGLIVWVSADFLQGEIPKYPLFILSWLLMFEIFFRFSLLRILPKMQVSDVTVTNALDAYTHTALDLYLSTIQSNELLSRLLHVPQVQFILNRCLIEREEVKHVEMTKQRWVDKALEVAKSTQGTYVTTMDFIVAYLLLSETETKLLFAKELKEASLYNVLSWARLRYPQEESRERNKKGFVGEGFGDGLISGWTPETKHYTTDFTVRAIQESGEKIGREIEYQAILEGLGKKEGNNILLVGETGVGKEQLVTTLAKESYTGQLSSPLQHKRIITLMVGSLLAGANERGELETRLQAIIAELSHAGNIILYIPEMEQILGESSYNLNLSGALLPYLKDGALPIIATMTPSNYKKYMEHTSLPDVFTVITLPEPDRAVAQQMLFHKVPDIEEETGVIIPYKSLELTLDLAKQYLPDDVLPGSAVRLLVDASQGSQSDSQHILLPEVIIRTVERKVHTSVAKPGKEEKALLLNLEEKLHARVIGQEEAIKVIAEAMRRKRSGVTHDVKPISFLFLGPTGVGKTETAKALADLYYGGEDTMLRLDMSEYSDDAGVRRLLGAPPGSGDERGELTDKIHDNPYTLVLLDEFEKANPHILDLFLQVLSDGRLTDNKGRTISFTNAIIIATSNAGSEFIREAVQNGAHIDKHFHHQLLDYLETNHLFKPELLNRFDGVVTFHPLLPAELKRIVAQLLDDVAKQLAEQDIKVTYDEAVIDGIVKEGSDLAFGARPLKRYIQDTIEDMIAKLTLSESVKRGDSIHFTKDAKGMLLPVINGKGDGNTI